ncbi:MAG: PqqD family protein [Planctomycetota bacterium]
MSKELTSRTRLVAAARQLSAEVNGEAVILNFQDGVYYGLNEVGARVWELVQERERSIAELVSAITAEYEVEATRCEADLIALVTDLAKRGLVELSDASSVGHS